MKRLKQWSIGLGVTLVVLLVVIVGSLELTSRPEFCKTCHYMEPFYAGWERSAHSEVSCVSCHFEPGLAGTLRGKAEGLVQLGKYATQTYKKSKPWAEIEDASCLKSDCHQEENLNNRIIFRGVAFAHLPHLSKLRRGRELRCTSCHSQIVQGDHITVTPTNCYTCHFKGLPGDELVASCELCHTAEILTKQADNLRYDHTFALNRQFSCDQCHSNSIIGDGAVYAESCYNCHFEPQRLNRFADTNYLHQTHITERKVECQQCHLTIQHKVHKVTQISGTDCMSCHPQRHEAQIALFTGEAGGGSANPSPMQSAGLNCRGCHIFHEESESQYGGETFTAGNGSCEHCHGAGFDRLLEKWQVSSGEQIKTVEAAVELVSRELKDRSAVAESRQKWNARLKDARTMIDVVKNGKSVHNMTLSGAILSDVYDDMAKLANDLDLASALPVINHGTDLIPGQCINCHLGVEYKRVEIFDLTFDHSRHLTRDVTCSACHSNRQVHGELLLDKKECLQCHHSQQERPCQACHEMQENLLAGSSLLFPGPPDPMWDSGSTCTDCHVGAESGFAPPRESCADCHDEDYAPMIDQWRNQIDRLLTGLTDSAGVDHRAWIIAEKSRGGHNSQVVIDKLTKLTQERPRL